MKKGSKTIGQLETAAQNLKPERTNLTADVMAGLTFAVVNVPQAMGHALLATVNPMLAIYTLIIALPIGALFTGSVFMNVSTTSALSVATASALAEVTAVEKTQALVALVFMVGVIQLLAGLFRLGFVVRFVSNSVMTGFLNGIAVLIILGQLGELTGYRSTYSNNVARALDLFLHLGEINVQPTIIGGLTLGLIVLLLLSPARKFAFIIAIIISTILLAVLSLPGSETANSWSLVKNVGDVAAISRALPQVTLPTVRLLLTMLLPALSLAIIGLIQGAGISQGYPNPDGKYPDVSRDFFGQGAANLATGLVGGIPAGGSVSGTVLITSAGARSRWTNILAGLFVAIIVLVAAPLVQLVPMPALAALLIVAGFQGLRIPQAVTIWNTGKVSASVMGMTFLATLFIPLQYAVLIGVAFSILLYAIRQSNQVIIRQWVLVPGGWPEERPSPRQLPSNQLAILQIYGSLFFAAAKNLEEMLPALDNTTRTVVVLGLRGKMEIGSTFITVLQRYAEELKARNSKLMLVGVDQAVYEQLVKTKTIRIIGAENVFLATPQLGEAMNQAATAAYAWLGQTSGGPAQSNPSAESGELT